MDSRHLVCIFISLWIGYINPRVTNGLSHLYQLDESISFIGASEVIYHFYFIFHFSVSKQNSPRWDALFCGVTSGAILFACVSLK